MFCRVFVWCRYEELVITDWGQDQPTLLLVRPVQAVRPPVTPSYHGDTVTTVAGELSAGAGAEAELGLIGGLETAHLGVVMHSPLVRSQQECRPHCLSVGHKVRILGTPGHPGH